MTKWWQPVVDNVPLGWGADGTENERTGWEGSQGDAIRVKFFAVVNLYSR